MGDGKHGDIEEEVQPLVLENGGTDGETTVAGSTKTKPDNQWKVAVVVSLLGLLLLSIHDYMLEQRFHRLKSYLVSLVTIRYPLPVGVPPPNFTFPSVDDRIRYYMSNWFDVPEGYVLGPKGSLCKDIKSCIGGGLECLHGHEPLIYDKETLIKLGEMGGYHETDDILYLFEHWDGNHGANKNPKLVIRFGDETQQNPRHPFFGRARYTKASQPRQPVKSQAIIGYMKSERHIAPVHEVRDFYPWEEKIETVVMRSHSHPKRLKVARKYNEKAKYSLQDIDVAVLGNSDGIEWDSSKYRPLFRNEIPRQDLTRYKYLLSIEGTDLSSGLKWMLFSNSVVFMAKPRWVSWALEEFLVPYVHYVPLKDDYSDLLEQLEWARAHDAECKLIAQHATQFMYDLEMSEQAETDKDEILRRMIQRYMENYGSSLERC